MNAVKGTIGVAAVLAGVGASVRADTFLPNFSPVPEFHGAGGGNTAGSFAAASMMGAYGHSGFQVITDWETTLRSACAARTGFSVWPGSCSPAGMAQALLAMTGRPWTQTIWFDNDQAGALNTMVDSLKSHGSPAVVPIYGQADHWVAVLQVTATLNGANWSIANVKYQDGGPANGEDGGTNSYNGGLVSCNGGTWRNVYFRVIQSINPACDPCTSDPWYDRYVLTWEPPADQRHTNLVAEFPRAPGVFQGSMTGPLAQSLVWRSLSSAEIDKDPQIWSAISDGVPGTAFEVNGVFPSGERWDYFLVPILSASNTVKAFVQMATDDGSFVGVHVPSVRSPFNPLTKRRAEQLALGLVNKGESLTGGILTWDPRVRTPFPKSPTSPYYEFGVLQGVKQIAVIRVSLSKGVTVRM